MPQAAQNMNLSVTMDPPVKVKKRTYAGLFMVCLATLMLEILLTRIFSVTTYYHFAFMVVSMALFGMTLGAILVFLLPGFFNEGKTKFHLALFALCFSVSVVLSFLAHLSFPLVTSLSVLGFISMTLTYVLISIPFIFSGICVCLALTRFPRHVSQLYATDLGGAALGCILLIYVLKLTDGPTAVLVVALLASLGAVFFAQDSDSKKLTGITIACCLFFAAFTFSQAILLHRGSPFLELTWVKGTREERPVYETWNAFSRITVYGDPAPPTKELTLRIDSSAATALTRFDGDLKTLGHLKSDVVNLAHPLRPDAKVLVIGAGGGRDILSALAFHQKSVLAIEYNDDIIRTVNEVFGDFTGHLDQDPRITFVSDEARSYVTREKNRFDIIQISLIDTWAATAAGAFVLTENSLYTTEAWVIFLNHLTPNGIFTVSRWFYSKSPAEAYRITSLASAALKRLGISDPRSHILMVRHALGTDQVRPHLGIGTMLVSRIPFSPKDLLTLQSMAGPMQFESVLTPDFALDATFEALASGADVSAISDRLGLDLEAPTDDRPFFFNMMKFRDAFKLGVHKQDPNAPNLFATQVLFLLLVVVVVLTFLTMIVPLILSGRKLDQTGSGPLFLFFTSIGLGFMFIEISQMQRLIIFLGHPVYGLSVVLFTLLLSSGLGSYWTQRITDDRLKSAGTASLWALLGILAIFGIFTPKCILALQASQTPLRILASVGMLFPLGFFMGMAFPLGMKAASGKPLLRPWFWGVNGAASVCASVIAVVIAMNAGISASFWVGFTCYCVALLSFLRTHLELR